MKTHYFHNYKITEDGKFYSKSGKLLKFKHRKRKGGGFDLVIRLYVNKKMEQFTASVLVVQCFQGPTYGYQVDHKDDNPLNINNKNLQRLTPAENQLKKWKRKKSKPQGKYDYK